MGKVKPWFEIPLNEILFIGKPWGRCKRWESDLYRMQYWW